MRSDHFASVSDVAHGDAAVGEAVDEEKRVVVRRGSGGVGGEGRGERVGGPEFWFFDEHIENNRSGQAARQRIDHLQKGSDLPVALGSRPAAIPAEVRLEHLGDVDEGQVLFCVFGGRGAGVRDDGG